MLAELLGSAPEYHGETSDHPIQRKDVKLLYEESLAAFLYSLFPLRLPDAKSQESLAAIVMAVITIIPPGGCLQLIGAELSRAPPILTMLILDGSLGVWSRRKYQSFISLTSNNWTNWEPVVNVLVEQCRGHHRVESWSAMQRFLQSFPCELCPQRFSAKTIENVPQRENPRIIHAGIRAFENLLGEHLGPWKVVISELALKSLRAVVCRAVPGEFELVRKGFEALASGEWMRGSLRRTISSDIGCRVPVYKVSCQQNVIIWQVDIAFDERHSCVMQVVKVWAICASTEVEEMCKWISLAQGSPDLSRIAACETVDLRKLKGTLFPEPAYGFDEHSSGGPCVNSWGEDCKTAEGSPILGKFFSLTSVVFDSLLEGSSASVFPIDPSKEELHVINHFKSPAFILGRSGTGKTTCLIYKLASRYLESQAEGQVPARQLLLTRSGRLTQKLKPYTKRLIDTRLGKFEDSSSSPVQENSTTWQECNEDTRQDIYSIGDDDFPLVCTFSHFLRLLENSFKLGGNRTRTRARILSDHPRTVDFDAFRMDYWRRFPASLTRKVPMGLAFLDIMGVIKGSASRENNFEPLSREAYIYKRWKLAPNFASREGRDSLYTLYQHYEKYKKRCGELDDIDRVVHVLKGLEQNPVLRREIESFVDEVYVDEVQDQRPLEIELLLSLIPDPRQIHFAGDTAQSISKDSLFRFPNAQALFYSRFRDPSPTWKKQVGVVPELLPLSHNYRSHLGIVSVASVVMELLYAGFPQLVDWLPSESGDNPGPAPTLYIGSNFLFALNGAKDATDDEDGNLVSLGAHRAILVRDEQTRNEVKTNVENPELILTILESKGMEFEDVFLYNFFSTTPSSNIPVLEQLFAGNCNTRVGGEYEIDIMLCSELKHLYVAITRAQNRLWIVESQRSDAVDSIIHLFNTVVPTLRPWRYPKGYPPKRFFNSNYRGSSLRHTAQLKRCGSSKHLSSWSKRTTNRL
ncbi:P-loop containing nucleoside triphosphate hydrolase protein [Wilcoxina mikolae CBS 423.85]|nr:P-loop containing nucleoside triphosphate hydrolase protein [Wilcoxina mikolae CBS 423.85]